MRMTVELLGLMCLELEVLQDGADWSARTLEWPDAEGRGETPGEAAVALRGELERLVMAATGAARAGLTL